LADRWHLDWALAAGCVVSIALLVNAFDQPRWGNIEQMLMLGVVAIYVMCSLLGRWLPVHPAPAATSIALAGASPRARLIALAGDMFTVVLVIAVLPMSILSLTIARTGATPGSWQASVPEVTEILILNAMFVGTRPRGRQRLAPAALAIGPRERQRLARAAPVISPREQRVTANNVALLMMSGDEKTGILLSRSCTTG
jgi:hypothetical protein